MGEEKKESLEMLADTISPIWKTQLGGLTLDQVYEFTRAQLARQGILLSRAGFLAMRGIPVVTPRGLVALAKLGVEVIGFQAIVDAPRVAPGPR